MSRDFNSFLTHALNSLAFSVLASIVTSYIPSSVNIRVLYLLPSVADNLSVTENSLSFKYGLRSIFFSTPFPYLLTLLYYIVINISIYKMNNIDNNILYNLYIVINRFIGYNNYEKR